MTKKQKRLILIGIIVLIVILGLLFLKSLFFVNQDRVYGDRLDGIKDVEVSDSVMNEMASVFKDVEGVTKTDARENGKIINLLIDVEATTDFNKLKEASKEVYKKLDKDQRKFYDIQIFFFGDGDKYPIIGYLHKGGTEFVWSNNANE